MPKTLLITGASSGVGLALARYLSSTYNVIAVARRFDRMEQALGDNPNVTLRQLDLSEASQVNDFIEWVCSEYGEIGYIINNAGINIPGGIETLSLDRMCRSLMVNALAPFLLLRTFLPRMKNANFGRVINITSGAPLNCFPGFAAYSASKAALNSITVSCAREYETSNIRINLMSPGPVRTEMAPNATMDPSVCFPTVDYLLNLGDKGPTGRFFWLGHEIPLFPDLNGIDWLAGKADERYPRVIAE